MKFSTCVLIIFLCCSQLRFAQYNSTLNGLNSLEEKLQIGNEFTYVVKYAFLNLGELRIMVYGKDTLAEKTIFKSVVYIDSYDDLPFVNIHQVYESWFDSTLQPVFFNALIFNDDDTSFTKYFFNDNNSVHIQKGKLNKPQPSIDTTVTLSQACQDGLSLLFYARFISKLYEQSVISCFINEDTAMTKIIYYDEVEPVSIDAVDYDIKSNRLEGNAGFTGIFGLSGDFRGWFSHDGFNVPILAELQVLIGNISVELMNWKRGEWQPPAYE